MYYLLSKTFPFTGSSFDEIFENIKKGKVNIEGGAWEGVSDLSKDLLRRLL